MRIQTDRKWLFFVLLTLFSLWLSGYVQREIHFFHENTSAPQSNLNSDFNVYYTAALVARSDTDKRLYSFLEVPDPNDDSKKVVVNPQIQAPDPESTYGHFAQKTGVTEQYLYPPFFSLTIIPLTYFSYEKASIIWHVLIFFLACASVVFAVKFLFQDYLTVALVSGLIISVMEFTHPSQELLLVSNVSSVLAFLIVVGIYLHRKHPTLGAFFFALAVIIKLTPIVIIPLMIIRRQWKWLIVFCCWSVLLWGISLSALGWQNHWEFFTKVVPTMASGVPIEPNKSLATAVFAVSAGKFLTFEDVEAGAYLFPNESQTLSFKLISVVTFCLMLGLIWYLNKNASQIRLEILLIILWSILFSPISFRHYYLMALPPLIYAWLHPLTRNASIFWLTLLSISTFIGFSILPSYGILLTNLFPLRLLLFLIMPTGIILCIVYLFRLLRLRAETLDDGI